ncbi:hypothetical protein PB2503_06842 [Parvularcula bermudensis HTCC2503]|uniref:Uncharacterized protein n=1 Tax=Parvularcula bermudensis (strain ATCC BAA-594 / HTCC2503 / KCTC 12087) TaxID=314260 RepID=E0TI95_PARBH|nr:polysaccharide biosynthesis/export family protein [Parvularcula bermudensis]ADM09434.1 hypothetical protein PB2503_06842 [Parvularcula bermudensis HTCC2503]
MRLLTFLLSLVFLAGCAATTPLESGAQPDFVSSVNDYHLQAGDRIEIAVYGEEEIGGEYVISPDGTLDLALADDIQAIGLTVTELDEIIVQALSNGFVRDPKVSVQLVNWRPFYILGEVNQPGRYDFEPEMTVLKAVALASGFTLRAQEQYVYITRSGETEERRVAASSATAVLPGDTIRVVERYF